MVFEYDENGKTYYGICLFDIDTEQWGFETLQEAQEERDRYFSDDMYIEKYQ